MVMGNSPGPGGGTPVLVPRRADEEVAPGLQEEKS